MKTCTKCGEIKPITEFWRHSITRDGLAHCCKSCAKERSAAWRAANPQKVKALKAADYSANKDSRNAKNAAWRIANPDKMKAYKAKWRAANPDKLYAQQVAYLAANPEIMRIRNHNRRAKVRENGGIISKDLAEKLFKLQMGKCACGCKQSLGSDYELDHRMPIALGGTNTDDNMQLLRKRCNRQKNAKHPIEFMQQRGFLL